MAYGDRDDQLSDADNEQLDEIQYATQKEAVIFLIDVSKSMCKVEEEEKTSHVRTAIECAYQFLTTKIVTSPKDKVGIVLYGTKETHIPEHYGITNVKNLYFLVDLDQPDAEPIKDLRSLLMYDEERYNEIVQPSAEPVNMRDVLFCGANVVFTDRASNYNAKRVFFITDNDDPCHGKDDQRVAARTRASDLNDLGIKIEPMFIAGEKRFDTSLFWDDIVTREDDELDETLGLIERGALRMKQMSDRIKAKTVPRRAHFTIPFEVAPGLTIGVKGYILYKRQEIARQEWVYSKGPKPQLAKGQQQYIDQGTSKVLGSKEVKRGYQFGDTQIMFTEDDMKQINHIEDPILRIVGFKSLDKLDFAYNVRASYFIYPSEADYIGSTRVFASLHKTLLAKKRFALAWFIPRRNAKPCMAAVVAGEEHEDPETKLQDSPPGLHLISLPFADDLRATPPQNLRRSSDKLTAAMSEIVIALQHRPYDPMKFKNPSLQWHWKVLQAYALDEESSELKPDPDQTIPKYRVIEKRAGELISNWGSLMNAEAEALGGGGNGAMLPRKRPKFKAEEGGGDDDEEDRKAEDVKQPRRSKFTDGEVPSLEQAGELIADGKFDKMMTVQGLKQIIAAYPAQFRGRPASTRKADLVRFIEDALS